MPHKFTPKQELELQQDLSVLETDLRRLLRGKLISKSEINALNIACGRADETGVLAKIIGEKASSAHIQGLDLRASEIDYAREKWKKVLGEQTVSCDFGVGRADRLNELKELDDPDLVFIRHQNYWFEPKAWIKLYDQALQKLKQDGVMVITSYFDEEHEMARQVLSKLGAVEIEHRFNPNARIVKDSPKVEKSVDRHISVFVKL